MQIKRLLFLLGLALSFAHAEANVAEQEPNNDYDQAQRVRVPETIEASLGKTTNGVRDDTDCFIIDVPSDGKLTIVTTTDTTLRLGSVKVSSMENGEMKDRVGKDMDGYAKEGPVYFEIPEVAAGTYYVKVPLYTGEGNYKIAFDFTPCSYTNDAESDDEFEQALDIRIDTDVQGHLGYYTNRYVYYDKYDWYRIEIPADGTVDFCTTTETTLRLSTLKICTMVDGVLKERDAKDMDGYGKETTVVLTATGMEAGIYYLMVSQYEGAGGYTLNCRFTPNSFTNDPEPNDEYDQAQDIRINTDVEGHLGFYGYRYSYYDKYDWYRIDIPSDGTVDFCTTTETSLRLSNMKICFEENGELKTRDSKDMDGYGKDTTVVQTSIGMAAGTYYVLVSQYEGSGGYKLNCRFTPNSYANDSEPNDDYTQAQSIACGQDIQGHLGFANYSYSYSDREDWYRIDLPADGSVDFQTTTETSLRLGNLQVCTLVDGEFKTRNSKDMDAYGKDTTIVFSVPDLAAGTYYVIVKHYSGVGGYIINCNYTKNPFYSEDKSYLEENSYMLTQNKTAYTTLGYYYQEKPKNEQWYRFSSSEPTTLEIQPDTTKSLVLGVVDVYKMKNDGSKERIYSERLERSYRSFDISEAGEYLVRVPRYSGYGGMAVKYGNDENGMTVPGSAIRVIVEGRNTVRKGVPCQNTVVVRNTSDKKTGSFFLALASTPDIKILKINLSDINGRYYEDMMYEDICNSDSSIVLYIPSLAPFEDYKVLVTSEGVGDIDYVKAEALGRKEFAFTSVMIAAAIGFAVDVCVDAAGDYVKGVVKEKVGELSESEARAYQQCMGITRQEYEESKYTATGPGACIAKKAIENTMKKVMKAVPGGSTVMKIGEKVAESADIITCLRRKIWFWIYKDLGYIKNDYSEIYDAKVGVSGVVASWDPNEMVGPQGAGDQHYIGDVKTVDYTIMFENKADAGDAAYRVRVFDELDENIFDVNSVKFGPTSHDGVGYNWKMTRDGNKLFWDIEGIELPPNKIAPEGEGCVTFSVDLKPGLEDGTQISNKATIIFDKNTPIETNVFTNTLDLVAPSTKMVSAEQKDAETILVKCNSSDGKSGVGIYSLFVSKDNGTYELAGQYPAGDILYTPSGEGVYNFYVLAVDNAGNAERTIPSSVSVTTNVEQVQTDALPMKTDIYDLSGRKVKNPVKGIYIKDGKKFIKK